MKKIFSEPEVNVIKVCDNDIICASGCGGGLFEVGVAWF